MQEVRTQIFLLRFPWRRRRGNEAKVTPVVAAWAVPWEARTGRIRRERSRASSSVNYDPAGALDRRPGRGLGLHRRLDQLLEESSPTEVEDNASGLLPVEVATLFRRAECAAARPTRRRPRKVTILQKHDLGTQPGCAATTPSSLTAAAEMLSRTEFPTLLKQLGATGVPNRVRKPAHLCRRTSRSGSTA